MRPLETAPVGDPKPLGLCERCLRLPGRRAAPSGHARQVRLAVHRVKSLGHKHPVPGTMTDPNGKRINFASEKM